MSDEKQKKQTNHSTKMSESATDPTVRPDIERAVLALVFDQPSTLDHIESSRFDPELFTGNRFVIASSIRAIHDQGSVPDFLSICSWLEINYSKQFNQWGGRPALRELHEHIPYGDFDLRKHLSDLEDALRRRKIKDISDTLIGLAGDPHETSLATIQEAQDRLFKLTERSSGEQTFFSLDEATDIVVDSLVERAINPEGQLNGFSTGFRDLDRYLKGLREGRFYIIAARPAMGKSAFALNLAAHIVLEEKSPAVFFSLEMGADELTERLISSRARVPFGHITDGSLSETDWARLSRAALEIRDSPMYIEQSPSITMNDIRAKCQSIVSEHGHIGIIIVDYIQLMMSQPTGGREANRQQEISNISREMKILSKDFRCPVIGLSQLNRKLEERLDRRPHLSDLRESGSLEQDADSIVFLYRDEVYNPTSADQGICEVIVAKNRSGSSGTSRLAFMQQFVEFADLAQ